MRKIVLVRHGQSIWNLENRFTGWADVDLSENGIVEAHRAGRILAENGYTFDVAYTSVLKRAIRTLWIILSEMNLMWIPIHKTWMLNERHYGALQGLNKAEMANKYGEEQVQMWRRSVDVRPPSLDKNDPRYDGGDPKYRNLTNGEIPLTENLRDTEKRVLKYWHDSIMPAISAGERAIITAHGNTIRALRKYLDNIPDDEIVSLNIPTGIPLVYELDDELKPVRHYYLNLNGQISEEYIPDGI